MKSKIIIDIDYDNQPIIRINYEESEDVRDGLVKRFLETFGHESSYASFRFVYNGDNSLNAYARLRPIKPEDMGDVAKTIMDEISGKQGYDGAPNGGADFMIKNNIEPKNITQIQ